MPRLIDAAEFFKDFAELEPYEHISHEYDIDAVEVVRCKDCKHFDGSYPMCCRFEETFEPEDYCSFGEKREVE